jgi:hypothetical protein
VTRRRWHRVAAVSCGVVAFVTPTAQAAPGLSCEARDNRFRTAALPAYRRVQAAAERQRAVLRSGASTAAGFRAQLVTISEIERVGSAVRPHAPCSPALARLRRMMLEYAATAAQARSALQAFADRDAAGDVDGEEKALTEFVTRTQRLERQGEKIRAYISRG